jgi:photosystem II stability/assembly factor-like uncharacterized protein
MKVKRRATLCLLLMLSLSVLAAGTLSMNIPASAQEQEIVLYQENFDDGRASGWELEQGWAVSEGALCGQGHHWARYTEGTWQDFRVQFRLRLDQGTVHLNYRVSGTHRYFIGFHQGELYLSKQTGPDTFSHDLAQAAATYNLGQWYQVEIAGQGGHLQIKVDGTVAVDYTDADPLIQGGIAFETLDDSAACVDDMVIYGLPPTPTPTSEPGLAWVRTGGPLGGLGYDVRMRPDNPDIMYVTDAWAGVFMSTDGGQTWFPSNEGITTRVGRSGDGIPVFCLTIDPHDYDTIWVGTQNVRGIFKSGDGGYTWTEMDRGVVESQGITFRGFAVDPQSSDVVYAAAEISSWTWAGQERSGLEFDMTQGVVYKTTDGGQNWGAVWRGDNLARYIWIDPRDSNTIYVSTGIFDREAANSDPASRMPGGVGIVKSTDGGQTWSETMDTTRTNTYVGTLFMHPQNPDILLAGTGNNQYHLEDGVYLSSDAGDSWQRTLSNDIITSVEFALSDPEIAYAGSVGAVYRSEDGGETWRRVSGGERGWGPPGVRAGFPIDFQVDLRDPDRIFANNYGGGNFLSTDGGRTWVVASAGYTGAQVRDIAVDPSAPGRVVAAARSGIFVSYDGGDEWTGLNYAPGDSLEWYVTAIDPTDPQHVLAANNWSNVIFQSRDAGWTWEPATQPPGSNVGWRAIVFAPSDPQTVYAGTSAYFSAGTFDDQMAAEGIYVSNDGGETWHRANDTLSQDANVTDLAVDQQNPQVVYAATTNHGLLTSSDGGQSWAAINHGLPGSPSALSVELHPSDTQVAYAGLESAGLYLSTDGGATWRSSGAGMNPEAAVSDIVFDPTNAQVMYASDHMSGVYRSTDGGATWRGINSGLRMRDVNALAISSDGQHLYAATEGEGVFRLDTNGTPPEAAPQAPASVATSASQPTEAQPTPALAATSPAVGPKLPTPLPQEATPLSPAGGICSGAAALPVALLGLVWVSLRRR